MAGQYQREKIEVEAEAQEEPTLDVAEVAADAQEMRYEAEKLADNELGDKAASWQTQYQREKSKVSEGTDSCRGSNEGEPSGVAADTQEEPKLDAANAQGVPMLDLNQSEKNEATADAHMVGSRRSTLPYGDQEEHETTAKYLPGSVRAPTVAAGTSTGVASDGPSGFSLGATKSAAPVQPASAAVKNSAERGQEAASELPSLADMFKPKPGEWDCQTCKTRNKPTDTIRCMACEEKPGAPAQAEVGRSRLDRLIETYDAIRAAQAAQDALRAEWKEKEKLRPLSQKVAVA